MERKRTGKREARDLRTYYKLLNTTYFISLWIGYSIWKFRTTKRGFSQNSWNTKGPQAQALPNLKFTNPFSVKTPPPGSRNLCGDRGSTTNREDLTHRWNTQARRVDFHPPVPKCQLHQCDCGPLSSGNTGCFIIKLLRFLLEWMFFIQIVRWIDSGGWIQGFVQQIWLPGT